MRLRSRGEYDGITRVDFAELAPDIDTFLGQAAYLQLGFFETLTELIALTPELARKEAISRAAGAALRKHEELVAVIREAATAPFPEQHEEVDEGEAHAAHDDGFPRAQVAEVEIGRVAGRHVGQAEAVCLVEQPLLVRSGRLL